MTIPECLATAVGQHEQRSYLEDSWDPLPEVGSLQETQTLQSDAQQETKVEDFTFKVQYMWFLCNELNP